MIKRLIKKYFGLAFLYSVIVVMILLMNARFAELNQQKSADEVTVQTAQNLMVK